MPTTGICSRAVIPTLLSTDSSEQSGLCVPHQAPHLQWDSPSISSCRNHISRSPKSPELESCLNKSLDENFCVGATTPGTTSTHTAFRLADSIGPVNLMPEIRTCSEGAAEDGSYFLGKFFGKDGKDFKDMHAERNKLAQRRFRKRQKDRIEELMAKLAEEVAEKEALSARLTDLQRQTSQNRMMSAADITACGLDAEPLVACMGPCTLRTGNDGTVVLSPKQILTLGKEEVNKLWDTYLHFLAGLLMQVGAEPKSSQQAQANLKVLVHEELHLLFISMARRVLARSLPMIRGGRGPQHALDPVWARVTINLNFTAQQVKALHTLWMTFCNNMRVLAEKQEVLKTGLFAHIPVNQASQIATASALNRALLQAIARESMEINQFLSVFIMEVLTPVQVATAVVTSYPLVPDVPAIILSAIQQAQIADSCLAAGGPSPTMQLSPQPWAVQLGAVAYGV